MEKLIDLGKYIEIELISWKITSDCGELLIALSWTVDSMNDVLLDIPLHHYCIGSRGFLLC
jgi:hypothetical protein